MNPFFERKGTWIIIKGCKALKEEDIFEFELDMHQFGNILEMTFQKGNFTFPLFCVIKYEFASHAIAAKTLLNAVFYKNIKLSVELFESTKESMIIKTLNIVEFDIDSSLTVEELFI